MRVTCVVLVLFAVALAAPASEQSHPKISMKQARAIAMKKVPGGKIATEELEREKGRLIYSFDMKTKRAGVTEVNIDAMTGDVVDVHHESPAKESAEKKQESKEKQTKH